LHNCPHLKTIISMKYHCLISAFLIAFTVGLMLEGAVAQDAAVLDSTHYKVEFENDDVRVLRITYGPGEKSVMHSHPASVVVFLSGGTGRMTLPDGTTEDFEVMAGVTAPNPPAVHQPENIGDVPFEIIQIELKNASGTSDQH
jgi:mannose-6-phosphate isomerase-like protein (cupin superfamily)